MRVLVLCAFSALAAVSWTQTRATLGQQNETKYKVTYTESSKARKFLELGMSRQPRFNVRAVLWQKLDGGSGPRTVKVEMSRDGKIHQIVVSPLASQGIEFVDDGARTKTYFPDDKCVIVQPSPGQDANDVSFRMKLVDRNYSVRIARTEKIAGRNAVVVEATPKNSDLPKRCYAIDEEKGFLLRLETCRDGGAPVTQFETKMIEFPDRFGDGTFRLENPMGVVFKTFTDRCVSPDSADDLKDELRFQPILPGNLPYGFVVQELQASTDPKPALAVRITDGLAKATIMEWRREGSSHGQVPPGTRVEYAGRITVLISGDLPDEVKAEILRKFVKAAKDRSVELRIGNSTRAEELGCDRELFSCDGESTEIARLVVLVPVSVQI